MSHYGIIYVAYQSEDLLPASLTPWVEAKRAQLNGHQFTICAVSVPFEGFPQEATLDNTRALLGAHAQDGTVDHVIVRDKPMKETEARGAALKWLVEKGVTATWQHDSDEIITTDQIARIVAFVEASPWMMSYRLSLRNAVFDEHTYLAEPFQPMRIHRTHGPGGHVADGFWDDNNVRYTRPWTRDRADCEVTRDIQMASMVVPPSVAWLVHLSWLNNARSKSKAEYQQRRWGPPVGAGCSFAWDESRGGLVWNDAHFALTGQPLPEVVKG